MVTVAWALIGYSLAFSKGNGFIGGFGYLGLHGVTFAPRAGTSIPHLLFMVFEATFCIITAALVSGAVVERMRFGAFLIFCCCGRCSSTRCWPTGCGAVDGSSSTARSTSPEACRWRWPQADEPGDAAARLPA